MKSHFATLLALTIVGTAAAQEFEPRSTFERRADYTAPLAPQIHAHLLDVVADLAARDVTALTTAQRARRTELVGALAAYADAGVFPLNDVLSIPTPIFIDGDGRACAVGHLMIVSGAADLAAGIAESENLAYVPEIETEGVAEWAASVGLTLEECATIQPSYGPCGASSTIPATTSCVPAVPNSAGHFAHVFGCGTNIVSQNGTFLIVEGLPPNVAGYFLNSRSLAAATTPVGSQGSLCLGGNIGRYTADVFVSQSPGVIGPVWVGWVGALTVDPTATPTPSGLTSILAGETWHFQCWYRDANPTPTSNFSDVLSIQFI